MTTILLCDNGSSRPEATLRLRQVAVALTKKTNQTIYPVSLQHANRIPADKLHGKPADTFIDFMQDQLQLGERDFVVLPLFFGNSKALTSFIPDKVGVLKKQFGEFELTVAEVVYPLPDGEPVLTEIALDHVHQCLSPPRINNPAIILVDHGSPIPDVTAVRKHLASQIQSQLPPGYVLDQAVMERREGTEYDFNGELLANVLEKKVEEGVEEAIICMLFFLPGRHAGEGGDIVEICSNVQQRYPNFDFKLSPLIAEHPRFIDILSSRLASVK